MRIYEYRTKNVEDVSKLLDEAKASIPKIIYLIKEGEDSLRFEVSEALGVVEKTTLDDVLNNFEDTDLSMKVPKIYDYTKAEASNKHFHNINYVGKDLTRNLIPNRTIDKGEVTKVEWYADADHNLGLSNLILTVDIVYIRDVTGFAIYRDVTRTWVNQDGTENEEIKSTRKYYVINPSEAINEGIKRRGLIVKELQMPILTGMKQAMVPLGYDETAILYRGRDFLDKYEPSFQKFVSNSSSVNDPADENYGRKSIIVEIEEESDLDFTEWLDLAPALFGGAVTIRQYIMSQLDVG